MAHRAAIYTVRLKKRRRNVEDFRYFGDPANDNSIEPIATIIDECFNDGFFAETSDRAKTVRCESSESVDDEEVRSIFVVGESGVVADIEDEAGVLQHQLQADEFQQVHCASLFRLPLDEQVGFWAVHLNNRRGAKTLIQAELARMIRDYCPGYTLSINSAVDTSALEAAITRNKIDKLKLRKIETPDDRADGQLGSWVDAGDEAVIELSLKPRAARIRTDLLRRFVLRGDRTAWPSIVEFEGITFDEASVEVELENGHVRSFNIEKPDSGFAMTEDLTDLSPSATEPSDDSLIEALGRVIDQSTT